MNRNKAIHVYNIDQVLNSIHDGIYITDENRMIIFWNSGAEKITGYSQDEVIGKSCSDNILVHVNAFGENLCKGKCPLYQTICDRQPRDVEVYLHHKDGHRVPVHVRTTILDENENKIRAIELFTDISKQTVNELRVKELERLAMLDPLTQLGNRAYVNNEISYRINEYQRYSIPFGIIFFDIDHFKHVNDTYGHLAGDEILKLVARNLTTNARQFDFFGRYGGEEFIGVIRNVEIDQIVEMAERLRIIIASSSILFKGQEVKVTISLGVTAMRKEDTIESLLDRVDKLMYKSKMNGRDQVSF